MDKFVLQVPKWQGELLFTREIVLFLGVILLVVVGTLFCFWGYKYFKTILFLGIGVVVCYGSYLLVEPMTRNLVIRLFLTVSLTFLGLCLAYFLDIILGYILDRFRLRGALGKRVYFLAAPLGAVILGLTVYYGIWRDTVVAAVISVACFAVGFPFQHVRRKKQVRFCCYNDLLRLKHPESDEDGLEYIALEPVAAACKPEPEMKAKMPETEPTKPEADLDSGMSETAELKPAEPEADLESEMLKLAEAGPEEREESESGLGCEMPASAGEEPGCAKTAAEEAVSGEKTVFVPVAQVHVKPVTIVEETEKKEAGIEYLLVKKMDQERDILEDAVFVRQVKLVTEAERHDRKQIDVDLAALAATRHAETALRKSKAPGSIPVNLASKTKAGRQEGSAVQRTGAHGKDSRKIQRKQGKKITQIAIVAATGFGLFMAGRASKGRD